MTIDPVTAAGAAGATSPAAPRLAVSGLGMTFGNNRVLRDIGIDVRPGEIHGLIGQNGSGKSTLAKVLTGLLNPDPGTRVGIDGVDLKLPVVPKEARGRGVAVVHQSLGLVESETVLENMRIGRLRGSRVLRRIDWRAEREAVAEVFERLGRTVPVDTRVAELREEDRATVAIARALQDARAGTGLIIFDESTRALGRRALEHFFQILDEIVDTGTAVLLITHRLEEIVDAADRVTVLRDGRVVEAGRPVEGMSEADLTTLMLGRALAGAERNHHDAVHDQAPAVEVQKVSGAALREFSLQVRPGEIVGLTGIAGSGYDDVPYLLGGVTPADSGTVTMDGRVLALPGLEPAQAMGAGIALVPEGRENAGLAMGMSVAENVAFPQSSRARRQLSLLPGTQEKRLVTEWIQRLGVHPNDPKAEVRSLSGGNQQKVLLAKWLATAPTLLLLHEPTQAVDVGARHTLVRAVRNAASNGCAVIVAGSDENELALLCDRILILSDGRVRRELMGEPTPDDIVEAIYADGSRSPLRRGGAARAQEESTQKEEHRS